MNNTSEVELFFHEIAPKVLELAKSFGARVSIANHKGVDNYATEVDVAVEDFLVADLSKRFPEDTVLAEEGHSSTELSTGRTWVIDPICGTSNIGKGIKMYCTNIALVDNGELVASCVVDHSQGEYIWSLGENKVYVGEELLTVDERETGVTIDIDFGSIRDGTPEQNQRLFNTARKIAEKTSYTLVSFNTSLSFAYVAIGKLGGYTNIYCHPWDIYAASFLIQQSGGIITNLDGTPWTLQSVSSIAAKDKEVHQTLVNFFNEK